MELKLKDIGNSNGHTVNLNCPYCHSFCGFSCLIILSKIPSSFDNNRLIKGICPACNKTALWLVNSEKELLLFPDVPTSTPEPNTDMPEDIKQIYLEACKVLNYSPRASAALSRLAIDKLTMNFSKKNTLNDRIKDMASTDLPEKIITSLNIVRVVGNNAVHPGKIDLTDDESLASSLLELINIIVEKCISEPKKVNDIYNKISSKKKKSK